MDIANPEVPMASRSWGSAPTLTRVRTMIKTILSRLYLQDVPNISPHWRIGSSAMSDVVGNHPYVISAQS